MNFRLTTFLILFLACSSPVAAQDTPLFPYRAVPQTKPEFPLSKAMVSVYEGNHKGLDCFRNELFTNFKYTPLKGFDYHGGDGTVSRRDSTKVIRANAKYYVWYTHQETPTPPNYDGGATETVPSRDWDLAEIWYATSDAGFTWEEQGVAVKKMEKPLAGWCSVSTPDILFWKGKYYLYCTTSIAKPTYLCQEVELPAAPIMVTVPSRSLGPTRQTAHGTPRVREFHRVSGRGAVYQLWSDLHGIYRWQGRKNNQGNLLEAAARLLDHARPDRDSRTIRAWETA